MANPQSIIKGRKGFQPVSAEDRFWERVDKRGPDECWPWLGAKACKQRYGRFFYRGKPVPAHRFSWELANKTVMPAELFACHRCDSPGCVNPAHIFAATQYENMKDAHQKGRTVIPTGNNVPRDFCREGHPLSGSNLYVSQITGFRRCLTCKRELDRRRRAARTAFLSAASTPAACPHDSCTQRLDGDTITITCVKCGWHVTGFIGQPWEKPPPPPGSTAEGT